MRTLEKWLGTMMVMVGGCSMDSADLRYPVALLVVGGAILYLGAKHRRRYITKRR